MGSRTGILLLLCLGSLASSLDLEGPSLVSHPSPVTYFSNSVGVRLECIGSGHPPVTVKWLTADGSLVTEIHGVRELVGNTSLRLLPFRGEDFLASIHDARYRCAVSNRIGSLLSPLFLVRTVIDEPFELSISSGLEDSELIEGNSVLLTCEVTPIVYKEFTKVIHWKFIDQYGHETEIESDGKTYQISSRGSLLILAAKYQQLFICVAQNLLNNKIQSSSPFMLKSKPAVGRVPPRSVGKWQRMIFTEIGKNIDILCLSMGNPSPSFRWEKLVRGKFVPVVSVDPKGRISGPLLSFDGVTASQNGTYKCEVLSSVVATFSLETDLIVSSVPKVELLPHKRTLATGQNVELKCETPEVVNHAEITWFHNGRRLLGEVDGGTSRIRISSQRLSILNIRYEDQGVWQCFVQIGQFYVGASSNLVFPGFFFYGRK